MASGGIPIARVLGRRILLGAVLLLVAIPLPTLVVRAGDRAPSPMDVAIAIDTSPSGFPVDVDGTSRATPFAFACVVNTTHVANATTVSGGGWTRYTFTGWSDGEANRSHPFVCDAAKNFTALYRTEYLVRFQTFPTGLRLIVAGISLAAPFDVWCTGGFSFEVQAVSPQIGIGARRTFANWSDFGAIAHAVPCIGAANYSAGFRTQYLLGVQASVPGVMVQVDGAFYPFSYSDWCDEATVHTIAVDTEQQGPLGEYRFVRWSDLGAASHPITCSRSMNYTAEFVLVTSPPPPSTPTYPIVWAYVVLVIVVLVVVFVVIAAVLVARSSSRRAPMVAIPLPPPGGVPAHVVRTPSGPPRVCPQCGRPAKGDWTYCSACGAVLPP